MPYDDGSAGLKPPQAVEPAALRPEPVRRRRRWPAVVVLGAAAGGALWFVLAPALQPSPSDGAATPAAAVDQAVILHPLDVTEAVPGPVSQAVRVSGELRPRQQATLNSKADGTVIEVEVEVGDRVAKGDVLLRFDPEIMQTHRHQAAAALAAGEAELDLARTQADRSARLAKSGVSAAAAVDTANSNRAVQEAKVALERANLEAADVALRNMTLRAPFDGVVARRMVEPGQFIAAGTEVAELVNLSVMTAEMTVPVAESVKLQPGQAVTLSASGLPERRFSGRIAGIAPVASDRSRSVTVNVTIDNPGGILRGGMFVSGEIEIARIENAVAVPPASLRTDAQGSFVLTLSDDRLVRQAVTTAPQAARQDRVVLVSGVGAGDRIVSGRLPDLTAGTAARVSGDR